MLLIELGQRRLHACHGGPLQRGLHAGHLLLQHAAVQTVVPQDCSRELHDMLPQRCLVHPRGADRRRLLEVPDVHAVRAPEFGEALGALAGERLAQALRVRQDRRQLRGRAGPDRRLPRLEQRLSAERWGSGCHCALQADQGGGAARGSLFLPLKLMQALHPDRHQAPIRGYLLVEVLQGHRRPGHRLDRLAHGLCVLGRHGLLQLAAAHLQAPGALDHGLEVRELGLGLVDVQLDLQDRQSFLLPQAPQLRLGLPKLLQRHAAGHELVVKDRRLQLLEAQIDGAPQRAGPIHQLQHGSGIRDAGVRRRCRGLRLCCSKRDPQFFRRLRPLL
mmetsp:Transcript_21518/g.73744  ORF Transcript_21518/g.73744 Transcript_21518/m.73744 type:complete len:332 (+) Transcript_21518:977-1972(+)